jgi:class 3 adenylate cyclase
VVHADVVGYSRLIGLDDSGTLDRMRRLRRDVFEPALAAHGGRIVNTGGDSLLLVFASMARRDLRCACSGKGLPTMELPLTGQSDSASGSTWAMSFRMARMCTAMW